FTVGVLTEGFSPHGSNLLKASELLQLYLVNFWATEHGYGGWHISLFRNVLYSTEVFYHILFFACILCFLHNRRPLGCLFLFLTCWAHPFTGLLLMLIVTVWLVIEWFYERGKIRGLLAAVLVIDALFLWYNNVFLRLDHEHRSVMAQIQGYSATLPPSKLLPAYGAILPLALVALTPTILKRLWPKSRFRLLYSWVGTAAFLNFHDLFLPFMRPIQPLHFSHGYLYFPLAVLAILVLQQLYAMRPKRLGLVGMLLLLLHLPANVIWSIRTIATVASECPIFAPSRYAVKILEEIDTIADPQVILVDLPPETLGVVSNLIPLFTKHLVIRGHGFNTPFTEEKRNLAKIMMERPNATLVPQLGMTALLTTDERLPFYSTRLSNSLTRTLWHHKQLGVVLVEVVP
ncbi:MAG: hypothetical protein N2Z21_09665, partial [Candidatus Sumerlaeaceae bacterium]|nr:hypothetical protein [Candidatus Sumerlaeaceae bacterium]